MRLLILACVVCLTAAVPQFHRVENFYGARKFKQEVILDEEGQYAIIVTLAGGPGLKSSINLHDFSAGFSAVKDVENGMCYLENSNHTIREIRNRVDELNKLHEAAEGVKGYAWDCDKTPVPSHIVYGMAGEKIGRFCDEYTTILVDRVAHEYKNLQRRGDGDGSTNQEPYPCLICIIDCKWGR